MTNTSNSEAQDEIEYQQEQKRGTVEIFVTLKLPINIYETAAGLYRIADFKSFDDYVSSCVAEDIMRLEQGQCADELVIYKITGKTPTYRK
jgi:hypothetical protein